MPSYENVRPRLATGDIVLFSGKGGISTGIKWFTGSQWSHVGMVLRLSEWDAVLLWESTTLSNIEDVQTGRERQGVQLVPLSERVRKYQGAISVRLLDHKPSTKQHKELSLLREEVKGRPYEQDKLELIKSAWDGPLGRNTRDLSSLFCSELVAEAYQRMGFLGDSRPANEFTPGDFSDAGELSLARGELSDEIPVKDGG